MVSTVGNSSIIFDSQKYVTQVLGILMFMVNASYFWPNFERGHFRTFQGHVLGKTYFSIVCSLLFAASNFQYRKIVEN